LRPWAAISSGVIGWLFLMVMASVWLKVALLSPYSA
jgi:hypothetical protein